MVFSEILIIKRYGLKRFVEGRVFFESRIYILVCRKDVVGF